MSAGEPKPDRLMELNFSVFLKKPLNISRLLAALKTHY